MSISIAYKSLNQKVQKQIIKELHLKAKDNFFSKGKYGSPPVERRDVFLQINDMVHLPFYYAKQNRLFKKRKLTKIEPWKFLFTLRDYQKDIIKECIEKYNTYGTLVLQLFCGFGKTPVSIYLAQRLAKFYKFKTLIILPDNTMIRQGWITCIKEATDAKIYVYGVNKDEPQDDVQIFLSMKSAAKNISQEVMDDIGHIIGDEAHLLCTQQSINQILRVRPWFVTMLTATFEKDDGFHKAMELIAGPHRILRVDPKPFYIIKIPTPFTPDGYKMGPRGKDWHDVQRKYENMPERNKMLIDIIDNNRDMKTLVLTYHVAHAKLLIKMLEEKEISCAYLAGNVTTYQDANVIVATFKKIGEGFDEKNACETWNGKRLELFILAVSKKKIEQDIGRVFRSDKPVMIFPVDNLSNNKAHFRECSKFWNHEDRNATMLEFPYDKPLSVKDVIGNPKRYLMKQRKSRTRCPIDDEISISTKGLHLLK